MRISPFRVMAARGLSLSGHPRRNPQTRHTTNSRGCVKDNIGTKFLLLPTEWACILIKKDWCESSMGERWTEDEIKKLVLLVRAGHKPDRIAEELGRSPSAVASRISRTNVHRVPAVQEVVANAPIADIRKMRKCRWCLRQFESGHRGEWTCPPCKETSTYHQAASS